MAGTIVILLVILWALGYISIPGIVVRDLVLFRVAGHAVTLWELLIFIVILWAIEALPSPLRQIIVVLALLWVLSVFGIIAISGFSQLLILGIIIGVVLSLGGHK